MPMCFVHDCSPIGRNETWQASQRLSHMACTFATGPCEYRMTAASSSASQFARVGRSPLAHQPSAAKSARAVRASLMRVRRSGFL